MTTTPGEPPQTDADAVLADAEAALETAVEAELIASMDSLDNGRRLMLVHAHPDDETIGNGATMAKYAAEGAAVTLVTCTLGEEGEVLLPELAHLAADREDGLGAHRVQELATAMEALGIADHRFLGGAGHYRDSGMMGEPSNERPGCFWQAPVDEAAALLVAAIREVRPQVLITYDADGGYGHPDHIQAHRVAMRAVELAADPAHGGSEPWEVAKVYWNAIPESLMRANIKAMRESGEANLFDRWDEEEMPTFVVADELVTTAIDAMSHVEAKLAAMRAHSTQIQLDGPFFALSNNLGNSVWGIEYYRLVKGEAGPPSAGSPATSVAGREDDLFAGIA